MTCNKKKAYNDLCLVYNVEAFLEVSYRHSPNIKMSQEFNGMHSKEYRYIDRK